MILIPRLLISDIYAMIEDVDQLDAVCANCLSDNSLAAIVVIEKEEYKIKIKNYIESIANVNTRLDPLADMIRNIVLCKLCDTCRTNPAILIKAKENIINNVMDNIAEFFGNNNVEY